MRKILSLVLLAGSVAIAACESFGQAMTAHTDVVARAAGHELTVDRTVQLLSLNPRLPAETDVVDAVANLWVDYILLATAASQDSTLRTVDLSALVEPHIEQEIVWKLREAVIDVDTMPSEEELLALFDEEKPGMEVRARHILLRLPADATPAQRDSVLAQARDLKEQAAGGADFGELATRHSQDPGSAQQAGDLGFFGRGQMVPTFEESAFSLEVGEISDPVESPFGIHVIRVEERRVPDFESVRDQFLQELKVRRQLDAEDAYITQLTEPLNIAVQPDAYDVARELARKPQTQLSGRAANRAMVTYRGGALTAREYLDLMRRFNARQRAPYAGAPDEQLEMALMGLTQNKILIEEARRRGLDVSAAERDSLSTEALRQLEAAALAAGLKEIQPQDGETQAQAIERRVNALMESILKGERNVLPLGPIGFSLRQQHGGQVFDRAFPRVVARFEATRPPQNFAPNMPMPMPQAQPQR